MQSMGDTPLAGQLTHLKASPEEIRSKLIKEAHTWIGTPWKHNQKAKGHGVDCVNFLYEIASASGIELPPMPKRYKRNVVGDSISSYLAQTFRLISFTEIQKGDILVFQWGGVGHHVGIVADTMPCISFIHANNNLGFVLKQNLDTDFLARLIEQYSLTTHH